MDQPTSKEPRGPVSLRIKFRSANLDQFIERYAVDVSRGGIFIRTREPLPVGTQLRFDFQLQDAAPLLAGEGTIVWIRENDPARAGVTPGMGVRFDKLTAASQPVLEKILADKARREQAGAPSKTGPAGGMAVRRPSSTFSALDPASARAAQAASGPPRVGGLSPLGAQPRPTAPAAPPLGAQPRATAPAAGSGPSPLGAQPRTTAPAVSSDPFGTRAGAPGPGAPRTGEPSVAGGVPPLESSGAFGRPRSTTGMNAQRPAPAPSALFEKPTADDIDRALAVLTEVDGPAPAPVAVPTDFSSRVRRPTDAQPTVIEAAPDVGDAPKAAHRRPTDAQPMVLESTPDVGDAPPRRSGTRPLFSGTGEMKIPTVPVAPVGETVDSSLLDEAEDEDDATSAWIGSGPTRVGGSEPELPPARSDAKAAASDAQLPPAAAAPSLDASVAPPSTPAEAPKLLAPDFAAAVLPAATSATSATKKKGSGATLAIVGVLLLAGAGAAYYFLKGPGRSVVAGAAPTPAATPEATAPDATAPLAAGSDAAAAAVPAEAAKVGEAVGEAKPGEAKPAVGSKTEEVKPEAKPEAPSEAKAEDKPSEAKPEGKSGGHRRRHHGDGEAAAAEAAPAVADVSPKGDAPSGDAPAKAASSGHVLKVSSSPEGAEVIVDGTSMGATPLSSGDVDPALPHSITIKKDGFEAYEHMIGGSDWPHAKNGVRTLRLNAKLRSTGGETAKPAGADTPSEPPPGLGTTPASPKRE